MTDFYGGIKFYYSTKKKKTVTKLRDIFDFEQSVFLPVFDSCTMYSFLPPVTHVSFSWLFVPVIALNLLPL